jgi:trk system potassium uptake protein TrkH
MLVPAASGLALGEVGEALAFVLAAGLAVLTGGGAAAVFGGGRRRLSAGHGLAAVALTWLLASAFAALPLALSGHYASFLDAYFEAVSGLTAGGLTLAVDLDHMARSVNLWRHLMLLLGGQAGIVVILTVFAGITGELGGLYPGEHHQGSLTGHMARTARSVWRVTAGYAAVAVPVLWLAVWRAGVDGASASVHAVQLFMAAFDTGGFATQSASLGFYRSPVLEAVVAVLIVAGALAFTVHLKLMGRGTPRLLGDTETRTFAASVLGVFAVAAVGLARTGTFLDLGPLLRQGFFQVLTAHTTAGLSTLPGKLITTDWGVLAPAMLVVAMAIGGAVASTAGGFKALRLGLVLKGLKRDVRRVLLPENALVVETYQASERHVLRNDQVRAAATLLLLFLLLYLAGALVALFYGYPLDLALFESTAAASTSGLSVGLVRPALEWPMKAVYVAEMLIGKLEFVAVLGLGSYLTALVRGRA